MYERVDSMSNYWKEYAKVHGKSSYSIPYNIRELWKEEEQGNKKGDIMYEFYVEQIVKYEFGCKEYSELLEYRHNYEERVTKEWDELSYDFMKYYSKNWFK